MFSDSQCLMKSFLGVGTRCPSTLLQYPSPLGLRSAGTQVCWEFEGLMNLVSELGITGSSSEGCLESLAWVEGFCVAQSRVR